MQPLIQPMTAKLPAFVSGYIPPTHNLYNLFLAPSHNNSPVLLFLGIKGGDGESMNL